MGVSTSPGAIVFSRIADADRSRATGRVMPTTPPLDAEYAAWPIWPSKAATLAMFTIAPRSPSRSGSSLLISVAASRIASKVPIRLIAITFENAPRSCGGVELAVPADGALRPADAGGVHQDPQRAELDGLRDRRLDLLGVGDVDRDERAADLLGERLALVGLEVGDDDLRARGGELAGDGGADARGGAGDDGRGSGDVHAAGPRTCAQSVGRPPGHDDGRTGQQHPVVRGPGDREGAAGHVDAVGQVARRGPVAPSASGGGDHHRAGAGAAGPGLARAALVHPHRDVALALADHELDVDALRVQRLVVGRRVEQVPGVGEVVDERDGVRVAHVDVAGRPGPRSPTPTVGLAEHLRACPCRR